MSSKKILFHFKIITLLWHGNFWWSILSYFKQPIRRKGFSVLFFHILARESRPNTIYLWFVWKEVEVTNINWRSPYLAVWSFFPYLLRLRLVSSAQLAIFWNYILNLQIIISWVLGHSRFFLVPYLLYSKGVPKTIGSLFRSISSKRKTKNGEKSIP